MNRKVVLFCYTQLQLYIYSCSSLSGLILEVVAQWVSALFSETAGSQFEHHRCAHPGYRIQPRYEAPGDLRVKLATVE